MEASPATAAPLSPAPGDIRRFFTGALVDLPALSRWLDELPDALRPEALARLSKREMAALYHAAEGFRPITLEHFVPADRAPLEEVIHEGHNSLLAFTRFQKRFCRPTEASERLWGYNEQPTRGVVGPGYFITRPQGPGELLLDYTELPSERPEAWPPIALNERGLSRFVYAGMQDLARGVSEHAIIGRVMRRGVWQEVYFSLCRVDP